MFPKLVEVMAKLTLETRWDDEGFSTPAERSPVPKQVLLDSLDGGLGTTNEPPISS